MENKPEKYFTKRTEIKNGKGEWSYLKVEIFLREGEQENKIGEYQRNYSSFYNTFLPFVKNGKEYALYSKSYMETSVMSLPDCTHIAETKGSFCPVDYFVPDFESFMDKKEMYEEFLADAVKQNDTEKIEREKKELEHWEKESKLIGTRAIVAGCYWGDDSGGWKIMMLDISEIENGKIDIRPDFGYFELPVKGGKLKDLIEWDEPTRIEIPLNTTFEICDDNKQSGFLGYGIADLPSYKGEFYDEFEVTVKKRGQVSEIGTTKKDETTGVQ